MRYQAFSISRIGASHVRRGLPCQDASASEEYKGAYIAVAADGHGSRRHFRSERGSVIACQVAQREIRALLDGDDIDEQVLDTCLNDLKQRICTAWMDAVLDDYQSSPWTEQELDEERALLSEEQFDALADGSDAAIAYGSTLCAVFVTEELWGAVQLGDGCFVKIGSGGEYDWPMPESLVNEGNRTASLCMRDPMRDFRHCWGKDKPAGLLVFTDGIEKVFPPQGKEVVSLLHWIWRNENNHTENRAENLARTLDMLTQRSPIGDDLSVAGIVDLDAEDAEPVLGLSQKRQELARLTAMLEETEGTIQYNERRLRAARQNQEDIRSGAVEQLQSILDRKRASAVQLREEAARLRAELGEPEPETKLPEDAELWPLFPQEAGEDAAPEQEREPETSILHGVSAVVKVKKIRSKEAPEPADGPEKETASKLLETINKLRKKMREEKSGGKQG